MGYELKVTRLANALEQFVFADIHSVEQAKRFVSCHSARSDERSSEQEHACRQVQHITDSVIDEPRRYGVHLLLYGIGTHIGTKQSAVREAITICASRYIERATATQSKLEMSIV